MVHFIFDVESGLFQFETASDKIEKEVVKKDYKTKLKEQAKDVEFEEIPCEVLR